MLIFKKLFDGVDVGEWIAFALLPSSLPFIVTLMLALGTTPLPGTMGAYIKMNDLIFMGISMCISNLTIWNTRRSRYHGSKLTPFFSMVALVVFGIGLAFGHFQPFIPFPLTVFISCVLAFIVLVNITLQKKKHSPLKPRRHDS